MSDESKNEALKTLLAGHYDKPETFSNRVFGWQPLIPRMIGMLRRLNDHFRSEYHCCRTNTDRHRGPDDPAHDTDCILEETAALLRELP